MTKTPFKDHFSTGSDNYAAHRPTYPPELVSELAKICPGTRLALDCGCGTGQLSVLLAEKFTQVIATDASTAQIQKAQAKKGVTYRAAPAEESGLPDSSVDLITVAQAAHWLDLDKFYQEVQRIAVPDAGIALISYGVLHVDGDVDEIVQNFYYEVIGPYWPAERRHVEEGYRNLPFPFPKRMLPELAITVYWTVDDLIGYVSTWSAVKLAQKSLTSNPVTAFERELRERWESQEQRRRVSWPLSLLVGNVPANANS
ncbi:class I SAM-dependent methyltransferase [Advenella sp. FME57]|uniref:class I SAM-dependent methyltransferase n=1 Tax=Advenella sp. FME57 TaxID=2742604 RepID=UPI001866FE86|nr:class I SAM-dependent methyltransferase [Advenella sp. FME57]